MKQWSRILVLVSLAVVLLIACREGEEVAGITAVPPAHTLMPTETVTETAVPPSTTLTNTPIPTATLPPTETPTPTLTPIPTPTPWPTISLWSTLTPEQSGVNGSFQVVDQIGGRINTVVVQNKIAYVGVGPRLWLLDVSRPETPVASGQSDILPDLIQHIAVLRDTAYLLTDDESGFWIVDVSQPQLPQILSFFETAVPIDFLREWNGRLYVAPSDDELDKSIFSIDEPHQPTLIGELPHDSYLLADDERVYTIKEDNENEMTISVADATDLNNLRSVSEVTIDFDGYLIDADQDQYYFLNFEHGPTLWVMDKDDSTHTLIELDIEMSPYVGSIQVKDHIIYMQENFSDAGSYGSSVYAFNVSKPRQIRELNRLRTGNRNFDLFIDENMVYVAAGEGLVIAEISEDRELHKLAEWRSLGDLAWIDANTHQVFALNSWDNRIFQFELSPPQHLQLMYEHLGERIDEVVLAGDIVFTTGWFDGIRRYESNMMPWQETVIFDTSPSTEFVRDMAVQGETLYALLDGDLGVLDISNPEHLLQIGELERLSNSYGALVVDNNHLFTWTENANEFKGLQAVSIANPVKPEQIGFWHDNLDSHLSGLFAHEDFVYLLTRCYKNGCNDESLLQIINVSNPDNMFVVGSLLISGMVSDITLLDSKLLLGGDKLRLVDITNPAQPQLISELDTPGYVYDVVGHDNLMYVADYAGGLLVLRLVE